MKTAGTLFVISAPSGAGKTSLVKALLAGDSRLKVSISYTTRPKRPAEKENESYHFVSEKEFLEKEKAGFFLESAKVFGHYYGTPKDWVHETLKADNDVLLEIDWQGACQIFKHINCVGIFIFPPSLEALSERLAQRQQDTETVIQARLQGAREEMTHYGAYQYLVMNEDFEQAKQDLHAIIGAARCRRDNQSVRLEKQIQSLLT